MTIIRNKSLKHKFCYEIQNVLEAKYSSLRSSQCLHAPIYFFLFYKRAKFDVLTSQASMSHSVNFTIDTMSTLSFNNCFARD